MNQDFSDNLKLLCSYYKSVAEVCRRIGINRAQFNRYLNGTTSPSNSTQRRICEFFGVEIAEILLPHEQFVKRVQARPIRQAEEVKKLSPEQIQFNRLNQSGQQGLAKYGGYYFEYYLSMACPGQILRTLIHIESQGDKTYYQRTERLNPRSLKKSFHGVYSGVVQLLSDRLFLIDYETTTHVEMTQIILYPSFQNRIDRLSGLRLGVSGSGERAPCCARVIYEYLGLSINRKHAVAQCGLYNIDNDHIDGDICQSIKNDMKEGDWHFRARF
ncbi:helix-turn-helix transcriptional regulator [Marinomonas profundimaris]|uniref:XRE family transcriptional regulator n=1 Tax=Marinomonas profundimaris TaxID=1208321 RepID=W1RWG0_9GAMM|nr:helix-turn-helix transcriptional regulator [Marinomonas profundimaris]ETI61282.1 XRE family transcriptional regulator [Marinomonas profundimaris]